MSTKSETRCPTQRCIDDIAKWGSHYHAVYDREDKDGTIALCERCGGKQQQDGTWVHRCRTCSKDVQPGFLSGLFVPYLCAGCIEAQRASDRASGNVCRMCGSVITDCCC